MQRTSGNRVIARLLACAALVALASCGGGSDSAASSNSNNSTNNSSGPPGSNLGLPPGPGTFLYSPIDIANITRLDPLGWINPPGGHTLPTDHVYFYVNGPGPTIPIVSPPPILPVYAPGSGTVIWILTATAPPYDSSVLIRMTGTFSYVLAHIVPDPNIVAGSSVTAGQRIGQTNGASGASAVDLGVINEQVTATGFVNPARYIWQQIHCDSPYKFFAEPLKSQLYAMVNRAGSDKDGRIDYDIPGTLQGNWFHESVPIADSMGPSAWPKQLAFVPDPQTPTDGRVSISSFLPLPGKWRPAMGSPDFVNVTVATGKVAYPLRYIEGQSVAGLLIVQLIDDTHIKVRVFPGSTQTDAQFDGNELIYTR